MEQLSIYSKILNKIRQRNKRELNQPSLALWIVSAVLFGVVFYSFVYADAASIIRYEVGFADSILHGNFSHMYRVPFDMTVKARENGLRGVSNPTYDSLLNLVLGIWGIPLYFYQKLLPNDIMSSFKAMAYGKSIYLVALLITSYLIYRICKALKVEDGYAKWGAYLYFSSILVTSCTGVIGQSDIIGMVFILLGVYYYVCDRMKLFFLFFIIAFPFKQYVLFLFLPLLLLKEKNIIKILFMLGVVYVVDYLCNFPIRNDPDIALQKNVFDMRMLQKLTGNVLPFTQSSVSVIVLFWGAVCSYCYLREYNPVVDEQNKMTVFISLLSMVIVFVSFGSYPYWYVHMAPFISIATVYYIGEAKTIMLFETIGLSALMLANYIRFHWCYDVYNMKDMLMHRLFGSLNIDEYNPIYHHFVGTELSVFLGVFDAAFVLCMMVMVWLSRPHLRKTERINIENLDICIILRSAVYYLLCYIPILLFIRFCIFILR